MHHHLDLTISKMVFYILLYFYRKNIFWFAVKIFANFIYVLKRYIFVFPHFG